MLYNMASYIKEETSISSIAYLPTEVGKVKSAIKDLQKLKSDWGIEEIGQWLGTTLKFDLPATN